jgi:hypothetical protein
MYNEAVQKYEASDQIIKDHQEQINDLILKAKLPVKGLSFNENGLFYNGLPFDETALSTSELIRVGIELAVGKNPNLGIINIARGESIGKDIMKGILEYVKKHDFQLFVEQVNDEIQELKIQISEA